MLGNLAELQRVYDIQVMLWVGGEPLLRPGVLREGVKLFPRNNVTTNGTLDLIELPNLSTSSRLTGLRISMIQSGGRGHSRRS